ncbi:hypothetical protein KEM55_008520 [Ascosphaera atra]|nr:hypothetical protein KEM55_008520 [Ascosphaera atra]
MRDPSIKSYFPAFQLGSPIENSGIGEVLKSDTPDFKPGQLVKGMFPLQEYIAVTKEDLTGGMDVHVLDNPLDLDVRHFLGALGMPGLTAWSSLYEIGQPKKGETIFVSAASGAVGALVGQIAKHEGLKVVGSVGSDDKLEYILKELGFDAGFNYKKEKPGEALKRLAPQGIDIYYENVGGEHLEAAINAMNLRGRIVGCGMISQYNLKPEESYGIRNLMLVVGKRIKMQGFIVMDQDMGPKHAKEHHETVSRWLKEGSFKPKLSQTDGIENAAEGLVGIFKGANFGKAVLKL